MCDMCDDPHLTPADLRARMFASIDRYGWMIQYVEAEPGYPAFAYTIGLTGRGLPELHTTDLPPEQAATVLNDLARRSLHEELGPCDTVLAADGHEYLLGQMVDVGDLLGALEVYGPQVEALNLTRFR